MKSSTTDFFKMNLPFVSSFGLESHPSPTIPPFLLPPYTFFPLTFPISSLLTIFM